MDGATASVSVAVVNSRTEAELIVGMLRSRGVSAAVSADDAGGQYPQMQIEGVRVLVAPADEASACRLLAAADDTPKTRWREGRHMNVAPGARSLVADRFRIRSRRSTSTRRGRRW